MVMLLQRLAQLSFPPNQIPEVVLAKLNDAKFAAEKAEAAIDGLLVYMGMSGITLEDLEKL